MGSYKLTQHLLALGHRRIAFFAGPVMVLPTRNGSKATGAPCASQNRGGRPPAYHAGSTIEEGIKPACNSSRKPWASLPSNASMTSSPLAPPTPSSRWPAHPAGPLRRRFRQYPHDRALPRPPDNRSPTKLRLGMAAMETMLRLLRHEAVETLRLPAEFGGSRKHRPAARSPPPGTATTEVVLGTSHAAEVDRYAATCAYCRFPGHPLKRRLLIRAWTTWRVSARASELKRRH